MADALIGSTGFVGGNLLRQARFDDLYHSRNIAAIRGQCYDTIVCAGTRAEKWKANQNPDADRAGIRALTDALEEVSARRFVLISTVDVYPRPVGVDESTAIDPTRATAYGRHRFELEEFVRFRFDALVVRLPGLFGPGLRKNIIYDLLHNHQVEKIHPAGLFQYYGLDHLWADVQTARQNGLTLVNFATAPLSTAELASAIFGRTLAVPLGAAPAHYDFRSRHTPLFGGRDGYLFGKEQVLAELQRFVSEERRRAA